MLTDYQTIFTFARSGTEFHYHRPDPRLIPNWRWKCMFGMIDIRFFAGMYWLVILEGLYQQTAR